MNKNNTNPYLDDMNNRINNINQIITYKIING
jgi:hypothetical protein